MALIKSISGIRGTIGGLPSTSLTPLDIVKFTAAYGMWLRSKKGSRVIIGRDARISGEMVSALVSSTLVSLGFEVIDLGLSTTPTVEVAVPKEKAHGGIILTASHNPAQWNALKLLNEKGEFISEQDGEVILKIASAEAFDFADVEHLGSYRLKKGYLNKHIQMILKHPWVDRKAIKKAKFKIAVDAVNSSGGIAVPKLLRALGVKSIKKINCKPTGLFAHNPEPLPENIKQICKKLRKGNYDLGIVVDPDVDRLVLITENGEPFGEEYTLVAVADYVIQITGKKKKAGASLVSNLSSSRALRDIAEQNGYLYFPSAVGEVNVVAKMKAHQALIGGEGNGGVIVPDFHYGRDALIGIALILSHLALSNKKLSVLKKGYPQYFISKNKIELKGKVNIDEVLKKIQKKFSTERINLTDGIRIDFEKQKEWVHLRKSNTEPIIRVIAEGTSEKRAEQLAQQILAEIGKIVNLI